jgi:hypothetical protein
MEQGPKNLCRKANVIWKERHGSVIMAQYVTILYSDHQIQAFLGLEFAFATVIHLAIDRQAASIGLGRGFVGNFDDS